MISEILDTINFLEAFHKPPTQTDREIILKHRTRVIEALEMCGIGDTMLHKAASEGVSPSVALERAFGAGFLLAVSMIEDILTRAQGD